MKDKEFDNFYRNFGLLVCGFLIFSFGLVWYQTVYSINQAKERGDFIYLGENFGDNNYKLKGMIEEYRSDDTVVIEFEGSDYYFLVGAMIKLNPEFPVTIERSETDGIIIYRNYPIWKGVN
jgi:hypothetical protein